MVTNAKYIVEELAQDCSVHERERRLTGDSKDLVVLPLGKTGKSGRRG